MGIFNDFTKVVSDVGVGVVGSSLPGIGKADVSPGILQANQLNTFIVGNAIGAINERIAGFAIKYGEANKFQRIGGNVEDLSTKYKNQYSTDRKLSKSILNTDVFDNITFKGKTITDFFPVLSESTIGDTNGGLFNIVEMKSRDYEIIGIELNTALVSISNSNNIAQTQPIGSSSGTVKEFMSNTEVSVNIECWITAGNLEANRFEYNFDAINAIKTLVNAKTSIEVDSVFLSSFDITRLCILNWNVKQVEGFAGLLQLSLSCCSDTDLYENKGIV
jgi:hypothetical protein